MQNVYILNSLALKQLYGMQVHTYFKYITWLSQSRYFDMTSHLRITCKWKRNISQSFKYTSQSSGADI